MQPDLQETISEKLAAGEPLTREDVTRLAALPDILTLGMLADEARRRVCGRRVTYVRVAGHAVDVPGIGAVPPNARDVRLTGRPSSLGAATAAVTAAKRAAGDRPVSGFSLADLADLASGGSLESVLRALRDEGLEMVAEAPLDRLVAPEAALEACEAAGFERVRLTLDRAPASDRVELILRARHLKARFSSILAINPLPMVLNPFRPTTGYEDVKMVALARLAVPAIPMVQVDWLRYGPKLAQVALTFGADDLDNVSPVDESPDGPRRSPLAEARRNIEAAGFTPVERDGRFRIQ